MRNVMRTYRPSSPPRHRVLRSDRDVSRILVGAIGFERTPPPPALTNASNALPATAPRTDAAKGPEPSTAAVPQPVPVPNAPSTHGRDATPDESDPDRALRLAIKDAVDRGNFDRAAKLLDVLRSASAPPPQTSAPVVDLVGRRGR